MEVHLRTYDGENHQTEGKNICHIATIFSLTFQKIITPTSEVRASAVLLSMNVGN
jgi:hypothetical protein